MSEDLGQLFVQLSTADRSVLKKIYSNTCAKVYGALTSLVDEPQAEKILKTVYLEVWQKREELSGLKTGHLHWLLSTARRHALAARQSASNSTQAYRLQDVMPQHPGLHDAPESALNALGSEDVHVLKALYIGGMSIEDASRHLNMEQGAVRTTLESAITKLREASK